MTPFVEISPNRKNGRCPSCHRLLVYRRPKPDGTTTLLVDADWERGGNLWERNWSRHDEGRTARHRKLNEPKEVRWMDDAPQEMLCGCGATLGLDFTRLGAWGRPDSD